MERLHAQATATHTGPAVALACAFTVVSGLGSLYASEQPKRLSGIEDPRLGSVHIRTIPAHRGERPSTEHRASGNTKHVTHITSFASPLVDAA